MPSNSFIVKNGLIVSAGGISATGTIVFSNLTTNGFIKTSGATGTLVVDTSTYLAAQTVNFFTTSQTLTSNSYNSFDATGGSIVATLPTAIGIAGQIITVRKTDVSSNIITMGSTLSQTINESVASTIILRKNGWVFDLMSTGSNWVIV